MLIFYASVLIFSLSKYVDILAIFPRFMNLKEPLEKVDTSQHKRLLLKLCQFEIDALSDENKGTVQESVPLNNQKEFSKEENFNF